MVLALQSGHHARSVRRALDGRPAGQRVDGQGARAGADRADGVGARRLGDRRGARLDDGDRSDRGAARARHRSDPQAGGAARPRRRLHDAAPDASSPPAIGMVGGWIVTVLQFHVASTVYWNSVVQGLYIQDVWMGLIKPFFLGFAIVTHRLPRRPADDRRHPGCRPSRPSRRRRQLGRGDRGRLPGHEAPHRADVLTWRSRCRSARRCSTRPSPSAARSSSSTRRPGVRRQGDPARRSASRCRPGTPRSSSARAAPGSRRSCGSCSGCSSRTRGGSSSTASRSTT